MKLGVIGAGKIVNDFLKVYFDIKGLDFVAIADLPAAEEKLKQIVNETACKEYYLDAEEMIEKADIDTVYIAVPNSLHYKMCKLALENNKNVICEKPFTSNYSEALKLSAIARDKGLVLVEAVTTHYLPNMLKIKEILPELGDIKIIYTNYSQYSSRYDSFRRGVILPAFDPEMSGGALMDLNIYNVNFLVGLFGEPQSIEYKANIERNIDTSGILIMDYGTFKTVSIGAKDCSAPITCCIQGNKGCITTSSPVNVLRGFKYYSTESKQKVLADSSNEDDYNGDKHRMYYEFTEFERMISNKDLFSANKSLEISLIVSKIQTLARKDAGIIFPADIVR